jgi:hypothetical protein
VINVGILAVPEPVGTQVDLAMWGGTVVQDDL